MSKKLDLIDRNELYNQIRLHLNRHSLGEIAVWTTLTTGEIASIIANTPTVDAVPVVRCVDCDYFKLVDGMGICKCSDDLWQTNDFCSYGEPKK